MNTNLFALVKKITLNQEKSALMGWRRGCQFWTEAAWVLLQLCCRRTVPAGHFVHITGFGILLRRFQSGAWLPGDGSSERQTSLPKMNQPPKRWSLWAEEESQGNFSPCLGDLATCGGWIENLTLEWWRCWNTIAFGLSWRYSLLKKVRAGASQLVFLICKVKLTCFSPSLAYRT